MEKQNNLKFIHIYKNKYNNYLNYIKLKNAK